MGKIAFVAPVTLLLILISTRHVVKLIAHYGFSLGIDYMVVYIYIYIYIFIKNFKIYIYIYIVMNNLPVGQVIHPPSVGL